MANVKYNINGEIEKKDLPPGVHPYHVIFQRRGAWGSDAFLERVKTNFEECEYYVSDKGECYPARLNADVIASLFDFYEDERLVTLTPILYRPAKVKRDGIKGKLEEMLEEWQQKPYFNEKGEIERLPKGGMHRYSESLKFRYKERGEERFKEILYTIKEPSGKKANVYIVATDELKWETLRLYECYPLKRVWSSGDKDKAWWSWKEDKWDYAIDYYKCERVNKPVMLKPIKVTLFPVSKLLLIKDEEKENIKNKFNRDLGDIEEISIEEEGIIALPIDYKTEKSISDTMYENEPKLFAVRGCEKGLIGIPPGFKIKQKRSF